MSYELNNLKSELVLKVFDYMINYNCNPVAIFDAIDLIIMCDTSDELLDLNHDLVIHDRKLESCLRSNKIVGSDEDENKLLKKRIRRLNGNSSISSKK